jgi:hypothetical protein
MTPETDSPARPRDYASRRADGSSLWGGYTFDSSGGYILLAFSIVYAGTLPLCLELGPVLHGYQMVVIVRERDGELKTITRANWLGELWKSPASRAGARR